MSGLELHEVKN